VYTTGEMLPFQERKKFRQILYSKATLGIFLVLIVLLAQGVWRISQKAAIARAERDEAVRALQDLQSRTSELQASLARFNGGTGIEEQVRQKFTVAKPGEEVVVVVDDGPKKSENGTDQNKSVWQSVVGFFRGE
jgi:cell division protein FtsB